MQFVWTFWHAGAKEDELRWSIRSVRSCCEVSKITVVGDRASWYTGHLIHKPKIPETKDHNSNDVISKIETISNHPEIDETFVWMMDDIYFLNKCTTEELAIPRASFEHVSLANLTRKKWKSLKKNTNLALSEKGYSTYDYATHLPHVISKEKLRKVFSEFNVKFPYLWEVLYGNMFRSTPIDCLPFLHRQSAPVTLQDLTRASEQSVVLNHGNRKGWTLELREWLQNRYPEKSQEEI